MAGTPSEQSRTTSLTASRPFYKSLYPLIKVAGDR